MKSADIEGYLGLANYYGELTFKSYKRAPIINGDDIEFGEAEEDWGEINFVILFDKDQEWRKIIGVEKPKTIYAGDSINIPWLSYS